MTSKTAAWADIPQSESMSFFIGCSSWSSFECEAGTCATGKGGGEEEQDMACCICVLSCLRNDLK